MPKKFPKCPLGAVTTPVENHPNAPTWSLCERAEREVAHGKSLSIGFRGQLKSTLQTLAMTSLDIYCNLIDAGHSSYSSQRAKSEL